MEVIVLHKLKDVTLPDERTESDSIVRSRMLCSNDKARGYEVLLHAQCCYNAMQRFREDRERSKRYYFGDQWGDIITVDGEQMTEEKYIASQGNVPLKTNLIRRLGRNVVGLLRSQSTEPTCVARDRKEQKEAEVMSTVLQYNMQLNRMNELYPRTAEEYLISGLAVHRKWYGWKNDKMECWTEYVQPNQFFIDNNMKDFRGWDCSIVGEIHDVSFNEVCNQFAKAPEDYKRLSEIYQYARDKAYCGHLWEEFGYPKEYANMDFLTPRDESRCRVIEVWRKETKPRYRCHDYNNGDIFKIDEADYHDMVEMENQRRLEQGLRAGMKEEEIPFIKAEWFVDSYWYYYYLTPMADILAEGETPYKHKGHPYVWKAYPFIDGEIHSFVNDIIDQQRYTNRLIMLNDWVIRSSAKGVLMIPEDSLGGADPQEFADSWTKFNGVIVYKPSKSGQMPHQVSTNSTNIGISDMLALQMKAFEEITGVNGPLQGKPGYSGMSAALYSQQTQNATVSLLDILDSFQEFERDAAYKDVKNIQQYYDQKRVYNISGSSTKEVTYDPEKIRDVEFDLSIVPSQATPAYRTLANEFLMELFRTQAISLEQLLEVGNYPFSDELLQNIRVQKEQIENGQVPQGVSPELMQRVQAQANPQVMQQLQR